MSKPFVNLDEVPFDDVEENGLYTSRRALFSAGIGARKLGYNLTELPPGKAQCPFHSHREEEEMFLILEGEGELRFGEQKFKLRRHDVVACPTGGAEVAHQIINTGTSPLRYLSLSSVSMTEVCEYPDSGKIGVFASTSPTSARAKDVQGRGWRRVLRSRVDRAAERRRLTLFQGRQARLATRLGPIRSMPNSMQYHLRTSLAFKLAAVALTLFLVAPLVALALVAIKGGTVEPGAMLALALLLGGAVACWVAAMRLRSESSGALALAWVCAIIPALASYPLGWGIPVSAVLFYYCFRTGRQAQVNQDVRRAAQRKEVGSE